MKRLALLLPLLFFLILSFILLIGCKKRQNPPYAIGGEIDLSHWNFNQLGSINLDGQWDFYWKQLLDPSDFSATTVPGPDSLISLPGYWNTLNIKNKRLSRNGFATCRLTVRLPFDNTTKALRVANIYSAYRLWVNGKLMSSSGSVAAHRHLEEIRPGFDIFSVDSTAQSLDLILQVSNYHYHRGGLGAPIRIGLERDIHTRHNFVQWIGLILTGNFLWMGIYHLVLSFRRHQSESLLYLGLFCLLWAEVSLTLPTFGAFVHQVFDVIPWTLDYRIDMLCYLLSMPIMLRFLYHSYPKECSLRVLKATQIIFCGYALMALTMPFSVFIRLVPLFHATTYMMQLYIFAFLIPAVRKARFGSRWILAGIVLMIASGSNDMLHGIGVIQTAFFMPLGLFLFIMCHAFVLSFRFSRAFADVESLSQELTRKNIALSRLDRLKDEFLAKTSHELRTPLNGIIGIAESLLGGISGKVSRATASNLTMIASSGKRLANLVNDILDFSRLQNRDIELHTRPTDIFGLVEVVMGVSKHLSAGKNLELINAVPENCPPVLGDEDRLQQILFNLVGNAIKFTDEGKITVSAIPVDSFVEISVSDSGIGIPPDKTEAIFQSFEQADASDTRAFGGTGLGLSITRHLVELHGGGIQVESTIGKGSTFRFTMPVSHEQPARDSLPQVSKTADAATYPLEYMQAENYGPQPSNNDPYQVLVVDDDPVNLQVVANNLMLEKISFQTASDGMAALARIESGEKPRIVLLDIMMPKISGYEVCRRLRKTHSPAELPIVMLTARNQVADLVAAYKAGANDYISKPISKDVLVARVNCHLNLKAAYDAILEKQRLEMELFQERQEKEHARLQTEKEKLEKLRYQLNPHFLFNALASIRGAFLRDKQAAYEMISHLSEFSRLSLSRGSLDTLTIARELEVIRHYLSMEQMRFGDYLTVSIDIEPQAETLHIPALVLHPLVENAIKYGGRTCPDALDVFIEVKTEPPDMIRLAVSNSGQWVEPGTTDGRYSTGTGIKNIKQRLQRYYPDAHRFETHTDNSRVSFAIVVPCSIGAPSASPQAAQQEKPDNIL
jgi:two-component system sensor histidine kinase ChiS